MGGRQKQAQRTKGNVKPSSSGRSAALLGNVALTEFPGLQDNIFPSFQNTPSEDLDPNIDPNFQLVLKNMNKKDSTTRVKALKKFAKLVENSDVDVLKPVLPQWPRLYCMLAGDLEHKVREAANDTQRVVVVQAKRNMAPYLRMLAGPWFIAQFDTYAPAASAAIRSFKDAFPSGKFMEAIIFCQEEILKFISENLVDNTVTNEGSTERTEKQDRNLIMCLQGYCNFLKIMSEDMLTGSSFVKLSENLLQSEQFWKLAVDKIPLVRSSWLAVLTLMLEKVPHLLSQHHQQVVNCVLGRLGDEDATVLPYVWQTALNVLVVLEDWSSYCDVDVQIYPLLWRVLREGGYGCAGSIYPNMLPLLNILLEVKKTKQERQIIVDLFFQSLCEGFNKKTVQQSRSESAAVSQCYVECIRYIGKLNILDLDLVIKHLIPVLEEVTMESKLIILSRGIFEHTSSLLRYWSSDESTPQYDKMSHCFWDSLNDMYRRMLVQPHPDSQRTYILKQQIEFCLCLKNSGKLKRKSSQKVHFTEDTNNYSSMNNGSKTDTNMNSECVKHMKHLHNFIYSMSIFYLKKVNEEKDMNYVMLLCKLVIEFNDPEIFQDLVHNCNFCEFFGTILKDCNTCSPYVETVVEFFFPMVQYLQESENEEILNIMCENLDILIWVLRIAKRGNFQLRVLQWLRTPSFSENLIALSKRVCDPNDSSSARSVLMECMSIASDGAFLVNISTISIILSELVKESDNMEKTILGAHFLITLEPLVSRGDNLLNKEQKEMLTSCTYKLVCLLFCLCCQQESVLEDEISSLSTGWQSGVNILTKISSADMKSLVSDMSAVVWKELLSRNLTPVEVDNLLDISINFINLLTSSCMDVGFLFLESVISQFKVLELKLRSLCENIEILLGASICNSTFEESALQESEINQYILLSVFISKLVVIVIKMERKENLNSTIEETNVSLNLTQRYLESDNWECEAKCVDIEEETQGECQSFENRIEIILQISSAVSMCAILKKYFQSMAFYNQSQDYIVEINQKFYELMVRFTKSERCDLINVALERAKENSGMWVHMIYLLADRDQVTADLMTMQTFYTDLLTSQCSEYSTQIFLARASEHNLKVQFENLDGTDFMTVAFWLKYQSNIPANTLSSEITSLISEWKNTGHKGLLYDCDISEKQLDEINKIVKKMQFLSVCLRKCPYLMKQDVWDFVIISAACYTQNLKHLKKFYLNTASSENIFNVSRLESDKIRKVGVFSVAVFDLLISIAEFCKCLKTEEFTEYNFDQVSEWNNVFAEDVRVILSDIYVSLSECLKEAQISFLGNVFLQKLCEVLRGVYEDLSVFDDPAKILKNKMMTANCKLIHSSVSSLQKTAHSILKNIIVRAVENDTVLMNNESFEESNFNITKLEIHPLLSVLDEMQSIVDIMLAEFSFGSSCILQPHTDTYYYTAAYLLLWDILLTACKHAGSELRYQYASILRNKGYLSSLLNNLFYLMPAEIFETRRFKTKQYLNYNLTSMFEGSPDVSIDKECNSVLLQHWACWVYCSVVSHLPALVRQWWSDTKPKISSLVQKVTVQYVTPLLCLSELNAIQNQTTKFKNMEIKVHSKVREVVAVYTIDEAQMELLISLPEEYPLATIRVISHSSSLVGTSQWQNWVKQLRIFLTHQNGSLWDGLLLWKSNLDKRFEGVEECYICFSILHGTNFQIPKLCCKTCKKKFHSPCLYKWFSTSNKSTCPICRNIF